MILHTILGVTHAELKLNAAHFRYSAQENHQPIVVDFRRVRRPNEKEISHGRVSWQTH